MLCLLLCSAPTLPICPSSWAQTGHVRAQFCTIGSVPGLTCTPALLRPCLALLRYDGEDGDLTEQMEDKKGGRKITARGAQVGAWQGGAWVLGVDGA